ncbi:MAG: hypothetical protein AAGB04_03665 [Pseudomonadota bacterium]
MYKKRFAAACFTSGLAIGTTRAAAPSRLTEVLEHPAVTSTTDTSAHIVQSNR